MRAARWGWVLVLLAGGAGAQEVTLEVDDSSVIGLHFDESVQVMENAPANGRVRLTPTREIDCSWSDDTSLECYLEEEAPLATSLLVELLPGLRTIDGKPVGRRVLHGETPRPALDASIERWEAGLPKIVLDSEHRILAADAAAALRLTIDGKTTPVKLRARAPRWEGDEGSRYELIVPPTAPNALLELAIAPGLRAQDGPLRGVQAGTLLLARINEPFGLRNAVCAGTTSPMLAGVAEGWIALDGCVPGEPIRLQFSRPLDKTAREAWIARLGPVFHPRGSGEEWISATRGDLKKREPARAPGSWLELDVDAANTAVALDVAGLRADDGAALAMPAQGRVSTVAPRPQFRAPHARALLADPATPVMQVRNLPADQLDVQTLSTRHLRTRTRVDTPATGDTPADVELPATRRALAAGGLARIGVAGVDRNDAAIWAAAPDFDVYTIADGGSLLVWANAWKTGDAIANARVELLQADNDGGFEVLVAGRTDADGVALLPLGRMPVPPTDDAWVPPLFVRVQEGGRRGSARAMLPLELSAWERRRSGAGHGTRAWGVADRPLYHAGDVVRWRIWQRDMGPEGYRAPASGTAVDLVLLGDDEQELHRWQATLDAFGAATGETRIPVHAPDGRYCVGHKAYDEIVCFRVGDFRPQDLWLRASAPAQVLAPGDRLRLEVEAGYYSGGSAAGVAIDRIRAELSEADPGEVHPAFAAYAFGSNKNASLPLQIADGLHLTADRHGRAQGTLPVVLPANREAPAFGVLRLTAEASLSDRESTTSNTVEIPYAAHARYVGVKLDPAWIDGDSPVRMKGVVVTADGQQVVNADIDVEVSFQEESDAAGIVVHRCRLQAGQATDCSFPRKRTGLYRISASSDGAHGAELDRYVWTRWSRGPGSERPQLEQVGADIVRGEPLRVLVQQPQPHARMLLLVQHNGQLLGRRVVLLDGPSQVVEIPTESHWPGQVRLNGYIRGGGDDKADLAAGFRQPVPVVQVQEELAFADRGAGAPPVTLAFEPARTSPGAAARIELRNTASERRSVTLTVMDDALHSLGAHYMDDMDPAGDKWARADAGSSYPTTRGFDSWNAGAWRWRLPTADELARCDGRVAVDRDECRKKLRSELGRIEIPIAWIPSTRTSAFRYAAASRPPGQPIDASSADSRSVLTSEQLARLPLSRSSEAVALLAPGVVAAAPPAYNSSTLQSVVVTGTTIEEPEPRQPAQDNRFPTTQAARPPTTDATAWPEMPARVRVNFAQTALWRNDIVLAPGETRTVEFVAPDNLTRWRAIAWSNAAGDDFAKVEATLEAGLPVEARLQSPVRVYPGDRTRVAVNVRHVAQRPATAKAFLRVTTEAGVDPHQASLDLAPQGQASFGVTLVPTTTGIWQITAGAATDAGGDAVALPLEIASPTIVAHRTQAGWLGSAPVRLDLPSLPPSATEAHLEVSIWRGNTALIHGWTEDLRDYPHRCWEQILSRAVGAALAIERSDPVWPDARAAVQEAIDNAALFQEHDGGMRYFAEASWHGEGMRTSTALTAYTVDALAVLRSLGHATPVAVEERARRYLQKRSSEATTEAVDRAFAAAVLPQSASERDRLWSDWPTLPLPTRIAAARSLARDGSPHAAAAFASLLQAAPRRGGVRVVRNDKRWERWMGSDLREQCSLIRLYGDFPQLAPTDARKQLQAGLSDLYAGGAEKVGTQEGAICLLALRNAQSRDDAPVAVDASVAARHRTIVLSPGEQRAVASFDAPEGTLSLAPIHAMDAPIAYLADITFEEEARQAASSAVGFSIERRYEVLRAHHWTPIAAAGPLRQNDWLRITLVVSNHRERHFVAVTDDLPGGLRPVELSLAGVAGVDVQALGDNGDWAFEQRRLDPRQPKFYAEHLWPGRHEIHYFARIGNPGDYLAAPAVAELMYGETTRARTAAARIHIADPKSLTTPAP